MLFGFLSTNEVRRLKKPTYATVHETTLRLKPYHVLAWFSLQAYYFTYMLYQTNLLSLLRYSMYTVVCTFYTMLCHDTEVGGVQVEVLKYSEVHGEVLRRAVQQRLPTLYRP